MNTVLLDLDGTLVDSAPGILSCYRAMLRDLGHTPDPAQNLSQVIGPAIADVMPLVLAHYGDTRVEQAISIYRRRYAETGVFDAQPFPGIPALLDTLAAAGKRLYVATAKRVDYATSMLQHLGLASRFEAIHGALPGGGLDHKPELIAHILRHEAIAAADAAMVGDRRYDITGAHANGVRAYGVLWGYGVRDELEGAGADALATTPEDLAILLLT